MINRFASFIQKSKSLNSCSHFSRTFVSSKENSSEKRDNESEIKRIKNLLEDAATFEDVEPKTPEDVWSTTPYPQGTVFNKRDQSRHANKFSIDPQHTSIILFPGQGTQYVGMGKNLLKFPYVKDLFEIASDILKYDLLKLCLEGPKEKLNQTIYSQPAIFVCSLAAVEQLQDERPQAIENCVATAGFSLGELTALVFAGALTLDSGIRLVKARAEAMQEAVEKSSPSGMMSVMYGPDSKLGEGLIKAREWCMAKGIEDPQCMVSNYLFPHCKIIAGHQEALGYLETNAKTFKLKRLKRLSVSGAFHTPIMEPAIPKFKKALSKIIVEDPIVTVYSNVDGRPYKNAKHIEKQLPKQIVKPVKWEQTLHVLYERTQGTNFPRTFECGPDQSLKTILKQVNAKASDHCFNIKA